MKPSPWRLHRRIPARRRRGNIAVLAAMLMMFLVTLVALVVDLGYINNQKEQLLRAADSGALAGAGALTEGEEAAKDTARDYVQRNKIGRSTIPPENVQVLVGKWLPEKHTFVESPDEAAAIKVRCEHLADQQFFARVIGQHYVRTIAESVAVYQPRDIMLVLDYSATMNDDSELASVSRLGRATVEDNLRQIYSELGSPQLGNLSMTPAMLVGTPPQIVNQLGLTSVAYPFPAGSWLEYVTYVLTDPTVNAAGYRGQFSYITLMNYWQAVRPSVSETPGLWTTSQQPITAVKSAVEEYTNDLAANAPNDQVGLVIFAADGGKARLELPLSMDVNESARIARERQAGHYERDPKMASGLQVAIRELQLHGRVDAEQLIVLVSDGTAAKKGKEPLNSSIAQAQRAAKLNISIVTMSLGEAADQTMMQKIADLSQGQHIHIPMDISPVEYTETLKAAFRDFAAARKARLVD